MLRFDERTHQGESNLRVASRYVSYFGYNNQRHQRSLYGIGYHGGADLYQLCYFLYQEDYPGYGSHPCFIVVIAAFVTILQMLMSAYAPDSINQALGIYIPLIVVNCIILGRAESFAAKNSPIASLFDGIGCGLGFTLGLTILGSAREILGAGSVFGITLLPETTNILMFILPPGAFLTLGYIIAIFNKVKK